MNQMVHDFGHQRIVVGNVRSSKASVEHCHNPTAFKIGVEELNLDVDAVVVCGCRV